MTAEAKRRKGQRANTWRLPCLHPGLTGAKRHAVLFRVVFMALAAVLVAVTASSALILSGSSTAMANNPEARAVSVQYSREAGLTGGMGIRPGSEWSECAAIDFGEVRPSLSPYVAPMAFQITGTSRENPIQVTIKGDDLRQVDSIEDCMVNPLVDPKNTRLADLKNIRGEPATIPCARIGWRISGNSEWSQLTKDPASLCVIPIGEKRNICLDFKYEVLWEDPVGNYSCPVTVSYSPQAEVVLSKAAPNPFSPNGDGIKDETTIACDLTWESDAAETVECVVAPSGDGNLQPVRKFQIPDVHSPATVQVTWDGTDESGQVVPDGCYRYGFHKAGESQEYASGIIVLDTTPPGLTVNSPKDGSEVMSDITVAGQTESEECLIFVFVEDLLVSWARPSKDGTFSCHASIPPGVSHLGIVSEDLAGNRSSCHMTVVNNTAVTILGPSYRETRLPVAEFQGKAPTNAIVTLFADGNEAGEVRSTGQGDWRVDRVRLVPGDNRITVSAVNQQGEVVMSRDPVTVRYVLSEGVGRITGTVTCADTGKPVSGAKISLVASEGGVMGAVTTGRNGGYEFEGVPEGAYRLHASCLNYCAWESSLIQLGSGEEVTIDFKLIPNRALGFKKSVDADACSIGDIVEYTLLVENLTDIDVDNVKVYDLLPSGIAVIPGTSLIRGAHSEPDKPAGGKAQDFDGPDRGGKAGKAVWTIGTLRPYEIATVTFKAAVGFPCRVEDTVNHRNFDRASDMTNKGYATGETRFGQVETPTREATLLVSKGIFTDDGLIFGKVFLDEDNDGKMGPGEHGLSGAVITTSDGREISTDSSGMYTIKGIRPGFHMVALRSNALPPGLRCENNKVLVDVRPYSIVRLDFPVTSCKPISRELQGKADLQRDASLQGHAGLQEDAGPQDDANPQDHASPQDGAGPQDDAGPEDNANLQGDVDLQSEAGLEGETIAKTYGEDFLIGEAVVEEPMIIVGVGEATISSNAFSGNLAFFLSGHMLRRCAVTCGLDLARCNEDLAHSSDPEMSHLKCGDESKVVRSLPYAGPLYLDLKWDHWEASFGTFRTDFIKSELAPYDKSLPGAIIRYKKGAVEATVFDSSLHAVSDHVQGGAIEAKVSPGLTLGGAIVKHRENPGTVYLYNAYSQYRRGRGLSAYAEFAGSAGGHREEVSSGLTGRGALSLRCKGDVGPLALEARYKAVGPHFVNPVWQGKTNISDFRLKAQLSPVMDLLPGLSLLGEVQIAREGIRDSRECLKTCDTIFTLGASHVLGDSGEMVIDAKHKTTTAEPRGDVAEHRTPVISVIKDESLGLKVKGQVTDGAHGSLGVRWGRRTDLGGSELQVGYSQVEAEAKGMIARDLSLAFKCCAAFESEDEVSSAAANRVSTKLGIGVGWTMSPCLESHAEVSLSPLDGAVVALRMTYKPASYLEAVLKYETGMEPGRSKMAFNADCNPVPGLRLSANYEREENKDNPTRLGYELSFTWRPVFRDTLVAFGGIKGMEARAAGQSEHRLVIIGQAGLSLVPDPLTDVSARCAWKAVSEGDRRLGTKAKAETGLVTLRITRKLGVSNGKNGNCGKMDVTGETSLYLVDVGRQRKSESAIEVGISVRGNVRLALGYKWTGFRHGAMTEAAHAGGHVYVRLGLGWATGI